MKGEYPPSITGGEHSSEGVALPNLSIGPYERERIMRSQRRAIARVALLEDYDRVQLRKVVLPYMNNRGIQFHESSHDEVLRVMYAVGVFPRSPRREEHIEYNYRNAIQVGRAVSYIVGGTLLGVSIERWDWDAKERIIDPHKKTVLSENNVTPIR